MKNDTTIMIGVIGVGHLGNFHLKKLKEIPQVTISGIYDNDPNRAKKMSLRHNTQSFSSLNELLKNLKIQKNKVAVEVNGEIIESKKYTNLILNNNDKVEIVHFIGGG